LKKRCLQCHWRGDKVGRLDAYYADTISAMWVGNAHADGLISTTVAGASPNPAGRSFTRVPPDVGNVQAFSVRVRPRTAISPGIGPVKLPDA
jgi:hypothetical protein